MDQIAEQGVRFDQAFSAGPATEISHGALFSGQFPSQTGLVGGSQIIPDSVPLMAESFSNAGYETFGISGPGKIRSELGFDRGFDEYVEPYEESMKPDISRSYLRSAVSDPIQRRNFVRTLRYGPDSLTKVKFDLLQRQLQTSDEPLFAFSNFLTCHCPYDPPNPYRRRAVPKLSRSRVYLFDFLRELLGRGTESIRDERIRSDRVIRAASCHGQPYHADPDWLTEAELDVLRRLYAASVSYLDDRLGEFLDFLDRTGLDDETIVVICSDHGEHLGEHGLLYHGDFLYDEVIKVPLLVTGPSITSETDTDTLASLVDLYPTLCELTDVPIPEPVTGRSLLDGHDRGAVFAEYGSSDISGSKKQAHVPDEQLEPYGLGRKCVRTKNHKLVYRSDDETELYALPDEETTIDDEERQTALRDRIRTTLGESFQHVSKHTTSETSPEVKENLSDLGYI